MKFSLSPPTTAPMPQAFQISYDTQLTVNAALVAVAAGYNLLILKNVSAGGQLIRIGPAPSFIAPIHGLLLNVNDVAVLDCVAYVATFAIANGAGGLLDILAYA